MNCKPIAFLYANKLKPNIISIIPKYKRNAMVKVINRLKVDANIKIERPYANIPMPVDLLNLNGISESYINSRKVSIP